MNEQKPVEPAAKLEPAIKQGHLNWWHKHKLLLIILGIFILAGLGAGTFILLKKDNGVSDYQGSIGIKAEDSAAVKAGKELSGGQCEGEGVNQKLSASPMKPEDFGMVIPYGLMVGDHVTPIDHQYFSPADYNSPRDAYPVYAMADGHITSIGLREKPEQGTHGGNEYRMVFTQTCTFLYYYDLVTSLSPDLNAAFDASRRGNFYTQNSFNFEVKAGQLIGYIGGRTLDFAVWDTTKPLKGFIVPEHYLDESWKLYTADPLEYYTPELKQFLLERYVRTAEPISGKIDYDADGRLIGNWFLEGTDYGGPADKPPGPGSASGHLSFSPEHLDPTFFVISMGDFAGQPAQFIAKGNTPWPGDVSLASGLIEYELVEISYVKPDGTFWDRKSVVKDVKAKPTAFVKGVVVVQMLEDRKIKFEAFPGKTAAQVSAFTNNAKIYVR